MTMQSPTYSVLITGIGGHGIMLISKAIAEAAFRTYPFVCKTESRGLSQRGGSVCCEVRFGTNPITPVIGTGLEDLIISTDALESARVISCLRSGGKLLTNADFTVPAYLHADWQRKDEVLHKQGMMKTMLAQELDQCSAQSFRLQDLAHKACCEKAQNTVILGAASHYLPLPHQIVRAALLALVKPEHRLGNAAAFDTGRSAVAVPSPSVLPQATDVRQPVDAALIA